MKSTLRAALFATTLLQPVLVWADTADDAGAKTIEQAVKTYGPNALSKPGLVRVSPDGEGYRLAIDTAKLIADAVAPMKVKEAMPLTFNLVSQADGYWRFNSANPFKVITEYLAANRSANLSISTESGMIEGVYDPKIFFPREARLGFTNGVGSLRDSRDALKIDVKDASLSSQVKDLTAGTNDIDGVCTFPQPEVRLAAGQIDGSFRLGKVSLSGFAELMNFWKVTAARKDIADLTDVQREEFKGLLAKYQPGMDEITAKVVAANLSTSQGGRGFKLETLEHETHWQGLGGLATLSMVTRINNLGIDEGIWPKALEAALPQEAALNLKASGFDMGAIWADEAQLRTPAEKAALPREHFLKLWLPDGKMTLDFADSFARSSIYDLTLSGQIQMGRDPRRPPTGTLTVTAKDIDTTVKYLQDNVKTVPVFRQASFGMLMLKGLGKAGADNTMVWELKFEGDGKITVNGQALPMRR
jgi:hypothetical protein